ncbi:Uncharacterized conserved protein [Palleronia marisminoris]|uniref:Extensin-like C-terminal domain-containing protein n=1 Tax=Palleronia marisminoris TaxID=315423 RepID=A0A1Y5SG04_9RHOB|nr:extensin family protein [Palleronia marisminoris]SFG81169.1 Uncharacterized conserved protein [Palleronia marisminoris]SLN39944.1 hypothetical protein PAM7066_01699 [Palleronia marisminoris]
MILRAACIALLATPALAQETPVSEAAPEVSETPAPRPDPEDRASEVAPDAPGEAPEEATAETPEDAPDTPAQWQTLRETPEVYASCLAALEEFGTEFVERDSITGQVADCGIANPIEVTEILPGVELRPEAVMRCETARALASWVSGTVVPAAARTGILAPLAAINHGSTYVCRNRGGVASGKVSEHGFGNAVDVMGFRFEDDSSLAVEPRADSGTIEEAFQRAVRGGACLDFTTVLGPGTDAAHADHLHLDVKERNGGYRICQ